MPNRKITLSDAEVRIMILSYLRLEYVISSTEFLNTSPAYITFDHNPSTQTISAEVTIKSE